MEQSVAQRWPYRGSHFRLSHNRKSRRFPRRSALLSIVLQNSFWGDDQNFSGPLMRFARGDMRDHIVSHKNDYGASYRRYGVLQWRSRLRISSCEIFGAAQFSTFATQSGGKADIPIAGDEVRLWRPEGD